MTAIRLEGRRVLLTGAGGGLGHDATLALLQAGAAVIALDHVAEKLERLAADAGGAGLTGLTTAMIDLADIDKLDAALAPHVAADVDILVNNAAIYPSRDFADYTIADYQAVQRVNVEAAVVCAQAVRPQMRARGWGRIVNISSVTWHGGWAKLFPYVASKAALVGLTRAWARELGVDGINVNAIAPGAFPTDAEKIHPDLPAYERFILEHQAIKRRGRPDDIAGVLLFLASDLSAFVTGQTINVDGGWVME